MENKKIDEKNIAIKNNNVITRKELFESKEKFHKEQARLRFEEKVKMLVRLQEIARSIKKDGKKKVVWKI